MASAKQNNEAIYEMWRRVRVRVRVRVVMDMADGPEGGDARPVCD